MKIKVFELDQETLKKTKKLIGEFDPKSIPFKERRYLKRMLDKSNVGEVNQDSDIYNDFLDKVQELAGYSDELMDKYSDVFIDTILLQTYAAWQPDSKK